MMWQRKGGKEKELFEDREFSDWKKGETVTITLDMDNRKISFWKGGKILGGPIQIEKGTYHPVISVKGWTDDAYQMFKLSF